jgi:hypothetical protein
MGVSVARFQVNQTIWPTPMEIVPRVMSVFSVKGTVIKDGVRMPAVVGWESTCVTGCHNRMTFGPDERDLAILNTRTHRCPRDRGRRER